MLLRPPKLASAEGSTTTGEAGEAGADGDKKGSYVGIHSTGFKDFLLKPELSRAIIDCGFEHPSEGMSRIITQFPNLPIVLTEVLF